MIAIQGQNRIERGREKTKDRQRLRDFPLAQVLIRLLHAAGNFVADVKNSYSVSIFRQSPVVILSLDSIGANTGLFGAGAFHKAKNYEQSQILIKL
jgi:hypothetical protein